MRLSQFYESGDKKQVTFYTSSKLYKKFQEKYPFLSSIYFNKCIILALKDKDFFDRIFFADVKGDDLNANV